MKVRVKDNSSSSNSTNSSIPTIPFSDAANKVNDNINVVGDQVDKKVTITEFPFKVSRCDQIVLYPCAYINNDDDYRVRKPGYVGMTAYYTNLYADKDGQKLIEHIIHTQMPNLPVLVPGADGCIKIHGDKGQKTMNICVATRANAINLLEAYKDFARCRLGDNLAPISQRNLKLLMAHCNVDKRRLLQRPHGQEHMAQAGDINNHGDMFQPVDRSRIKHLLRNKKHKEMKPQFDFPGENNNKWEHDRLQYFMASPLRVPGSNPEVKLPIGIQPGLNPLNNPGVEPMNLSPH
jgi:hypothetical protein